MEKEDLKNTKFIVHDDEKTDVKNHLKKLGIRDCYLVEHRENFFSVNSNNTLEWFYNSSSNSFIESTNKLITVEDILSVPLPEPKYRPCKDGAEALQFIGKSIFDKKNPEVSYHISAVTNHNFVYLGVCPYEFICFQSAFKDYTLIDDSPVGIKEE